MTLDGRPYTVKKLGKNTISLTGEDGKVRTISDSSVNWPRIKVTEGMKKPVKLTPAVNNGPRVIAQAGVTPATASPLELRPNKDGTLTPFHEGHELLDFDSGNPVKLPAGVSNEDALAAIKQAGAFGRHTKVFRDEPSSSPPSPQTKADQAGATKAGSTGAGQAGEDGVSATRSTRSEAARVERSRLTPLDDKRLKTAEGRQALEGARADIGWAQRGGELIRDPRTAIDPNSPNAHREGDVIGRTPWIGSDLWRERPEEGGKISEAEAHQAFDRALAGEPMTARQKRFVQYALDIEAAREWVVDGEPLTELDSMDAQAQEALTSLLAEATAQGLDVDALQEDAAKQTEGQSHDAYREAIKTLIAEAVTKDGGTSARSDSGAEGSSGQRRSQDHGQRGPPEEGGQGLTVGERADAIGERLGGVSHLRGIIASLARAYIEHGPDAGRARLEDMAANARGDSGFSEEVAAPGFIDELDAKLQAETRAPRFVAGRSLTKEQRKKVLGTLVDVYKAKRAPRELKGLDSNGNERHGYVHSPDLFEKSDITGAMVRYHVTLPDGRLAHPSELLPDYTQADIDAELARQQQEAIQAVAEKESRSRILRSRVADTLSGANTIFNRQNPGRRDYVPALLTDGKQFARTAPESAEEDAVLLGHGWRVEQPEARPDLTLTAETESDARAGSDRAADVAATSGQQDLLAEPAGDKPTRPTETIELRKRLSVLNSLLECLTS